MADDDKKDSLPSFSPTPTLDDLFNGNTTIGRIKSMQCMRDGADPKACAREELKKKEQRYADHASGKDPLPPSESLALRSDIDRLSQIVDPGSQSAWPAYSEAENAYMAEKAMAERRAANNIGIAAGSPVFTALPAAGRVLGASENAVEGLAVLNVDIVGALGFGGRGGGRGRSAKPASNETTTSRSTSPSPKPASPGNGTYVEKASPKVSFSTKQLDKKAKHSADFGVDTTKKNPQSLSEYEGALRNHLDDPATIQHGTYQYVPDSTVHFNPKTNNVVIVDKAGEFVSGWKLDPSTPQFTHYLNEGVLR